MSSRISNILLLIFSFAIVGVSQAPQSQQPVPGTRVRLVPPAGFSLADQLPGFFMHDSVAASIMVTEFDGSFAELVSGFTNTAEVAKRGMELLSQQEAKGISHNGCLIYLKQNAMGGEYRKWLFIFGDEKESVIIDATFPKALEGDLSERLKASLLTAKWEKDRKAVPFEPSFTITAKGELKLTKTIPNALIYTKSGVLPSKSLDDPLFVVSGSSKVDVGDKEQFTKSRLSKTVTVTNIEIERFNPITVDRMTGYEIFAKAIDTESHLPMVVYQLVLFENTSYYIMQGLVSSKYGPTFLPVFAEMGTSFRRQKNR